MSFGRALVPVALGILLCSSVLGGCTRAPSKRLVLIVIDTLRRDHLSCYGGATPTPHIDALAKRGTVFGNAQASFHQTTMSMASLFTGRTPSLDTLEGPPLSWNGRTWCGMARFAAAEKACIPAGVGTLAESLRAAGYWTIGIQSNYLLFEPAGFARGFDDWVEVGVTGLDPEARPGLLRRVMVERRTGPEVLRAMQAALKRRPHDRFFLYVHLMDVHDWELAGVTYEEGVAAADAAVGAVLLDLEEEGLLSGAVVVLTSDHGEGLGEKGVLRPLIGHEGNPSLEPLLEVPLVVAPPIAEPANRFLRGDDVFRLLQRIAVGKDQDVADLEDGEQYVSEAFFRTYRKDSWKSFHRRQPQTGEQLPVVKPPPPTTAPVILIDLAADPAEQTNVAASHPEIVRAHRARTDALAAALAAPSATAGELSEEDRARLRALGYLD
jgi:arylsulfatase A-like enzyme